MDFHSILFHLAQIPFIDFFLLLLNKPVVYRDPVAPHVQCEVIWNLLFLLRTLDQVTLNPNWVNPQVSSRFMSGDFLTAAVKQSRKYMNTTVVVLRLCVCVGHQGPLLLLTAWLHVVEVQHTLHRNGPNEVVQQQVRQMKINGRSFTVFLWFSTLLIMQSAL